MDKKQIGSVVVVALAILFIGASIASSKTKTLKKIKAGSITNPYIKDGAVNSAKIEDGTVSSADIADNSITTGKIADGQVSTDDLANSSVTTAKIASDIIISTTGTISADYINVNYIKFSKKTSAPVTCNTSNDGVVALTSFYSLCACNGSNGNWYQVEDYSSCQWN